MSKGKKAVIIIAAIVVVLAVAAGIILMPRHGKTVADTWSPYDTYGGQKWIRTIEKQPGKDFKILQITDTQLYMLPGDNKKALELTKELVTEEKPDLVVLTGDNVSALFTDWLIDDVIDCMESLGVPGAPVFGNHDGEGKADLKWQGEQFMKAEHCLYQPGPSNLTGEGNYIINVTEVDTDAELGLNKKDIMIKYTNLELLHAVLASTMPYGRLSARYRGKRKAELQSRIAMVESVLETRGDQLAKAEQIMYLDTAERSAICHYLGIIYTRLIAQKLYGIDCMVPLNLIEQPGEKKFVKYNGAYRQDLIGYGKQNAWSVWEPVGRSENSQAAFGNGCRAASEIEKINENPLAKSAACMTYYERGYLNAVVKEPERTGDGTLWFPEENYFKAYYQPFFELFADEQPGELYGSSGGFELELTLPWTEEGKRGFRHLQIGTDPVTIALMREGKYDQIFKRMENVLDLSKECRFCGEDGIWVGAE